jgi:hypothetical protein
VMLLPIRNRLTVGEWKISFSLRICPDLCAAGMLRSPAKPRSQALAILYSGAILTSPRGPNRSSP